MSAADGGSWKPQSVGVIDLNSREQISEAARDVLAERRRQIEKEGWTTAHDDEHDDGSLAIVGAIYALSSLGWSWGALQELWPRGWDSSWFRPGDRRRSLVKAGALIIAEIDRLDRSSDETAK